MKITTTKEELFVKCSQCGTELEEDLCPNCGKTDADVDRPHEAPKKEGSLKASLCCFIATLLVVVICFAFGSGK